MKHQYQTIIQANESKTVCVNTKALVGTQLKMFGFVDPHLDNMTSFLTLDNNLNPQSTQK